MSEFQPVGNPAEAETLLHEAVKTHASTLLWTPNQEHNINTYLSMISKVDQVIYAWVPPGLDPAKFMDDLASRSITDCFFSISLARANIFFKSRFVGIDKAGLRFKTPGAVFKVQRRKDLRFRIPDGHVLKAEFEDPVMPGTTLVKKILDLSAGGIAILVTEAEAPMFTKELTIQHLTFTFAGRKVTCNAEVRHAAPHPDQARFPGIKVGLLFKNIREADVQFIASAVFEESRKYFMKLF